MAMATFPLGEQVRFELNTLAEALIERVDEAKRIAANRQ